MNDPNGLIRVGQTYHLFYQHNPDTTEWGNIHWGHATSPDLLHWTHQPIALRPNGLGQAFSGTVVDDRDGLSGFGSDALIAVLTRDQDQVQRQALAVSSDGGVNWAEFEHNPIIDNPGGIRDFRDPKVLRHGDGWSMLLAVGPEVWVYRSRDLVTWERTSVLAPAMPDGLAIVEVPDLVEVSVAGEPGVSVWALIMSLMPFHGRPGPRSTWYLTGTFDGTTVTPVDRSPRRLDHAERLYAPMVWDRSSTSEPPVLVGWIDDHEVSADRGHSWRGRLSTPRLVGAKRLADGTVALTQQPIDGVDERQVSARDGAPESAPDRSVAVAADSYRRLVRQLVPGWSMGWLSISGAPIVELSFREDQLRLTVAGTATSHPTVSPASGSTEVITVIDHGVMEIFAADGVVAASLVLADDRVDLVVQPDVIEATGS